MTDVTVSGNRNTFPKLLEHNARSLANRAASREKEYGVWQTWTWSQVHDETRALAMGLSHLGLKPGDKLAIVGSNRPRLYWSIVAAQMCGAVPVPVYADSVAEEMKYVFEHAEVAFAVVEDQEQVDKILSVKDELPMLSQIVYEDPRGLRNYDHSHLHPYQDVQALGRIHAAEQGPVIDGITSAQGGDDGAPGVILGLDALMSRPRVVMRTQPGHVVIRL